MPYEVNIRASASESLRALTAEKRERMLEKIDGLETDPRPAGSECLEQGNPEYRRILGSEYEIIYHILDAENKVNVETVD